MTTAELTKYTVTESGCWNYTGYIRKDGYGYTGDHTYAHLYFYTHKVGPVPDGLVIDHLCMNKSCVNPAHLEPVSQAENMRRAHAVYGPSERCRNGHDRTTAGTMPNGRCRRCNREKTQRYRASLEEKPTKPQ